jgi:hypothetical protein
MLLSKFEMHESKIGETTAGICFTGFCPPKNFVFRRAWPLSFLTVHRTNKSPYSSILSRGTIHFDRELLLIGTPSTRQPFLGATVGSFSCCAARARKEFGRTEKITSIGAKISVPHLLP